MFSGIIEALGVAENISRRCGVTVFGISAPREWLDVKTGDSISVNGACLTVTKNVSGVLAFDATAETLRVTNLGSLRLKDKVNLERALKLGDRISGHFVTGHIDCVGVIRRKTGSSESAVLEIAVPGEFTKFILPKGSIAVDGISLTIAKHQGLTFSVSIIPHTLANTTLKFKGPSGKVNIEFDMLCKLANRSNF